MGGRRETVRYDAYGMPFGIPRSNTSGGARVTFADSTAVNAANGKSVGDAGYNVRVDINLDAPPRTVNSTDTSTVSGDFGQTMGRGVLSRPATATAGVGNSRGYAGYAFDDASVLHHVRHRVSSPIDGRWLRRDPIGYVDGASLYEYVAGRALAASDPMGLSGNPVACLPYSRLNSEGAYRMSSGCLFAGIGSRGDDDEPVNCTKHRWTNCAIVAPTISVDNECKDGPGGRGESWNPDELYYECLPCADGPHETTWDDCAVGTCTCNLADDDEIHLETGCTFTPSTHPDLITGGDGICTIRVTVRIRMFGHQSCQSQCGS